MKIDYEYVLQQYPTPLYLFDIDSLYSRLDFIKEHLPKEVSLCYALKSNTFIVKDMFKQVERFEICSPGEANICLSLGMPEEKMVISGVYKEPEFIEALIINHPHIGVYTVESMAQYFLIKKLSEKYKLRLNVLLRLTSGNQFGLDKGNINEILKQDNSFLNIKGLQYFSGTQKNSIKRLKREVQYVDSYISEIKEVFGFQMEEIEFGPGFPVFYFEQDNFDEKEFLKEFSLILEGMSNKVKLTLELGRSIAASCGTYLTKVVDTKCNEKENYAIVDGGIHHIAYYGQMMAMKVPKHHFIPERKYEKVQNWNICGSLCTINDILVKQLPVQALSVGDVIAFENTGAYCCTEGISLFLSRDLPSIVLCRKRNMFQLVRSQTPTSNINMPKIERK